MMLKFVRSLTLVTAVGAATLITLPSPADALPATRVYLNGRPTPVYFNDGDSFRVLGGPLAGTKARLAGFNTLESYGAVHRWGTWTAKELYWNAKHATLNAQRGVWHCTSKDLKRDTYGRILWFCLDLAVDQVRRGYAHAMTINYEKGHPAIVAAMRDAIKNKRGMWSHGVPDYVLTSLHSVSEGGGRDGKTYNRLVSTLDGHSAKWEHKDSYGTCAEICSKERKVSAATIDAAVPLLLADAELKAGLDKLAKHQPRQIVADYARLGHFVGVKDRELEKKLYTKLEQLAKEGKLGSSTKKEGSCVVYVIFTQRFGPGRASCLK